MHHERCGVRRNGALKQSGLLLGERIALHFIGEGKSVGRIFVVIVLAHVPCGLGKTVIERPQPGTGNVGDHAVEHLATLVRPR